MANSLWRYFHLLNSRTDQIHFENGDEIWPDGLHFLCLFDGFGSLGMEVLVTVDLNADVLPGSPCPEGRALVDISVIHLIFCSLLLRTTNTSKTLIDVALTTEFYHQLRCKYLGSWWSLFGGGHTKAKSPEASAFLYCYQKLQNLQSWVISDRFGVRSFPHCKYFGRF